MFNCIFSDDMILAIKDSTKLELYFIANEFRTLNNMSILGFEIDKWNLPYSYKINSNNDLDQIAQDYEEFHERELKS